MQHALLTFRGTKESHLLIGLLSLSLMSLVLAAVFGWQLQLGKRSKLELTTSLQQAEQEKATLQAHLIDDKKEGRQSLKKKIGDAWYQYDSEPPETDRFSLAFTRVPPTPGAEPGSVVILDQQFAAAFTSATVDFWFDESSQSLFTLDYQGGLETIKRYQVKDWKLTVQLVHTEYLYEGQRAIVDFFPKERFLLMRKDGKEGATHSTAFSKIHLNGQTETVAATDQVCATQKPGYVDYVDGQIILAQYSLDRNPDQTCRYTSIYALSPATGKRQTLIDADLSLLHEYRFVVDNLSRDVNYREKTGLSETEISVTDLNFKEKYALDLHSLQVRLLNQ